MQLSDRLTAILLAHGQEAHIASDLRNLLSRTSDAIAKNPDAEAAITAEIVSKFVARFGAEPPADVAAELLRKFKADQSRGKNDDDDEDADGEDQSQAEAAVVTQQKHDINLFTPPPTVADESFRTRFMADFDSEGVFFYQCYNDEIADYAVQHQAFNDCPAFNTSRMTWIKPSFGWALYRSGYGCKPSQNRVLRIKLSHAAVAQILTSCKFVDTNKDTRDESSLLDSNAAAHHGRVQWDSERDVMNPDGRVPRAMLRQRAIQIGVSSKLSQFYVSQILSVADVTALAHKVGEAHRQRTSKAQQAAMQAVIPLLAMEKPYLPALCSKEVLVGLGLLPGPVADIVARLGLGRTAQTG